MFWFSVDFNKEHSGVFGGVLDDQRLYLELCVKTVLGLYKNLTNPPTSVSIVAHSLGGKIAQSILMSERSAMSVNTIVALASPLDRPVLNIDVYFEAFYRKVNKYWDDNRIIRDKIGNTTNTCCNDDLYAVELPEPTEKPIRTRRKYTLENILLVTIGGGSRDLLVHSGLTSSRFSDVHAMSSCIPGVWLTTDHLSAVWCLQQVLVVNRFLYSIIQPLAKPKPPQNLRSNSFIVDKNVRLAKAKHYFTVRQRHLYYLILLQAYNWIDRYFSAPHTARDCSTRRRSSCRADTKSGRCGRLGRRFTSHIQRAIQIWTESDACADDSIERPRCPSISKRRGHQYWHRRLGVWLQCIGKWWTTALLVRPDFLWVFVELCLILKEYSLQLVGCIAHTFRTEATFAAVQPSCAWIGLA